MPSESEGDPPWEADETAESEDSATEVTRELKMQFWGLVVTFNISLLAVSVGILVIGFLGDWRRGGIAVLLGLGTFAHGVYRLRGIDPG